MNETWIKIFEGWLESKEAIEKLRKKDIVDEEQSTDLKLKLLNEILTTVESEIY